MIEGRSRALIEGLKAEQVHPVIVTGDHHAPAQLVADALGIDEVYADQLPEDKAAVIKRLLTYFL